MLSRPPGQPLGNGVDAHCAGCSPLSQVYTNGIVIVFPLCGSMANGSFVSFCGVGSPATASSSGSIRSDLPLRFQSFGTLPAEHGFVWLAISSAVV